ncbi:TPA: glycosyltransferase [Kluyvera ascorbata F0526]|nr:glycosyltransferase [Kluyvera ascorbata F0526]
MNILYVNWVPSRFFHAKGGGVSLYQKNLIDSMIKKGHKVTYVTAGYIYSVVSPKIKIRKVNSSLYNELNEYEIINSEIMAPSFYSFDEVGKYFTENKSRDVFLSFIKESGGFDVIHFNNLEGFPVTWLDAKDEWPNTKFVLSLHNYFPFCAQVNLWHKDKENCVDFEDGSKCKNCNVFKVNTSIIKAEIMIEDLLGDRAITHKLKRLIHPTKKIIHKFIPKKDEILFSDHKIRRENFVRVINERFDSVLAVSERVKQIALNMGVDEKICQVSYIGTKHAEKMSECVIKKNTLPGFLTIAYLGYMRFDKGFYFLLDSLDKISEVTAKKISIVLAAPITDQQANQKLMMMKSKFNSIIVYDGYGQSEISEILKPVDLGLVPVMWEDNLPQIAYEFVSNNVPVLASDLGGASELSSTDGFRFEAGNSDSFIMKLENILNAEVSLESFWANFHRERVKTMEEHADELFSKYYN